MNREDARRLLVAYDIPDDRRRTRLAKTLERFGDRVQYSVFVVDASPARLIRLKVAIESVMHSEEDSVLMCDLGPVRLATGLRFEFMGRARPVMGSGSIIV